MGTSSGPKKHRKPVLPYLAFYILYLYYIFIIYIYLVVAKNYRKRPWRETRGCSMCKDPPRDPLERRWYLEPSQLVG